MPLEPPHDLCGVPHSETCARLIFNCKARFINFEAYNFLDVPSLKHYRINHSKQFSNQKNHNDGIENFWSQTKRHMRPFQRCSGALFHLFSRSASEDNSLDERKTFAKVYALNLEVAAKLARCSCAEDAALIDDVGAIGH